MNNIETEFGFDEYIMPTTYSTMPKVESYDAQLYPSAFGYYDTNGLDTLSQPIMMAPAPYDMYQTTNSACHVTLPPSASPSASTITHIQHQQQQGSSSPESMSSRLSPPTVSTPLLSPHHQATITEKIANVNKLPESFLPEFHQYSKETYENGSSNSKKRRRTNNGSKKDVPSSTSADEDQPHNNSSSSSDLEDDADGVSAQEVRRQIHIQSEQKRRAQIKDGFEELRQHLPGCVNKKMSKAALLHRTVQHLQHLKKNQTSLLAELERMMNENEQLRKFQESVLQKQALERMYQMGM
ncbi:60S ribosomal protein L15 [Mucor velutinosus]|uniref:60S ribosomal protein L15 n=1 Tax=Mucor velutinosus TaxID=708070 RepID=A0AAN7HU74_9FUNG|nr:60S ribosomal protein L15 [Mucor velutinosus]